MVSHDSTGEDTSSNTDVESAEHDPLRSISSRRTTGTLSVRTCAAARDDRTETTRLTPRELLNRGGEWLGAARSWIQCRARNGSEVTWGSNETLQMQVTVADIEHLAACVASLAMAPQPSDVTLGETMRAKWAAEIELAQFMVAHRKLILDVAELCTRVSDGSARDTKFSAAADEIVNQISERVCEEMKANGRA